MGCIQDCLTVENEKQREEGSSLSDRRFLINFNSDLFSVDLRECL